MKKSLFRDLEPEYVEELRGEFLKCVKLRDQLSLLLSDKIDDRVATMSGRTDFEDANWAQKNAYDLGYVKGLSDLISLLS